MSKQQFRVTNFRPDTLATIAKADAIISEYGGQITDSRAKAYIEKYGTESWELDALPPKELNRLVEQAIARNVDKGLMDAVLARENAERERVRMAIKRSRES
jgi:hypothetical protein